MAESNVFPAFIRLQVDDQDGFAQFNTKLANELNRAKRTTEVSLGEIERVISGAITGGQIGNFTVDTKGAREAAVASEQRAESARKMAVALHRGDGSRQGRPCPCRCSRLSEAGAGSSGRQYQR